jgi:division protein CdvB (Snf7/Vps24/ESCRT-III family)
VFDQKIQRRITLADKLIRGKGGNERHVFRRKIGRLVKPSPGLKKSISLAVRRIELQIQGFDKALQRFSRRDESIFNHIVKAYSTRNILRAKTLANELAELRKVEKMLSHAKLALEGISLRLKTVSELGDIITVLAPAAGVINNIRSGIGAAFPEANRELDEIGNLLTEITSCTSQTPGLPTNIVAANEDAEKILEEATSVAQQEIAKKLPEIETEVSEENAVETRRNSTHTARRVSQ